MLYDLNWRYATKLEKTAKLYAKEDSKILIQGKRNGT